jgi:hypothetical protein
MAAGARPARDAFDYADSGLFELLDFVGIVREKADSADAQGFERLRGKGVVPRIGCKSELAIRFHGIQTIVLQLVSLDFIEQPDSAAFLGEVQENSRFLLRDSSKREFELGAAIAPLRFKNIARKALRMNSYERRLRTLKPAVEKGNGLFGAASALNGHNLEIAKTGRQFSFCD